MLAESKKKTTGPMKDATASTERTVESTERTAEPKDSSAAAAPPHPIVTARAVEKNVPSSTLQDPLPASLLEHVSFSPPLSGRAGNSASFCFTL